MIDRPLYVDKIMAYADTPFVKILTGCHAAIHELLHALILSTGIIVTISFIRLIAPQIPRPAPSAITSVCNVPTVL